MRCCRAESTSFSSSRCAVSSTSAAGASKATRPLRPRIVSPRWMPRPMPNAADRLEPLDQRDRRRAARRRARRARRPRTRRVALGRARLLEGAARQHPRVLGQRLFRAQRLLAADRHAPQAAVDRVGGAERRHRQLARFQVRDLLGALEGAVADGRQDLKLRAPACAARPRSAPGRCRRRSSRGRRRRCRAAREVRDGLRLQHALGADAERIGCPRRTLPITRKRKHLLEVSGARVDEVVRDGAERARARSSTARRLGVDAAGVDRERDHRPAMVSASQGTQKEVSSPPENASRMGVAPGSVVGHRKASAGKWRGAARRAGAARGRCPSR